jgi:hypothetical protein
VGTGAPTDELTPSTCVLGLIEGFHTRSCRSKRVSPLGWIVPARNYNLQNIGL